MSVDFFGDLFGIDREMIYFDLKDIYDEADDLECALCRIAVYVSNYYVRNEHDIDLDRCKGKHRP